MNHSIKCPDCQSEKIAIHGYERLSLLCVSCALVFTPELAIVKPDTEGNLRRLMFMTKQISPSATLALYRDLTGRSKTEAKKFVEGITFESIKITKT